MIFVGRTSIAVSWLWLAAVPGAPVPTQPPNPPSVRQWALDAAHLDSVGVWRSSTGANVVVAVVDSGVDARHADLAGRVLAGADFTGNAANGQVDVSADAHGTSVAGVIAGTGRGAGGQAVTGLAPGAEILPVRVADGAAADPVAMAQGIDYATKHGARVINISMCMPALNPQVRDAVAAAIQSDIVVIAAAGNDALTGNRPKYPAALPGVLAVAGTDAAGNRWPNSESGDYISLAAPAVGIYTAGAQGGYLTATGTSFAAPQVAAAAALLRSAYPGENATQIINRLTGTATSNGHGRTPELGYGIVNPSRALLTASPPVDAANSLLTPPQATRKEHSAGRAHNRMVIAGITLFAVIVIAVAIHLRLRLKRV